MSVRADTCRVLGTVQEVAGPAIEGLSFIRRKQKKLKKKKKKS